MKRVIYTSLFIILNFISGNEISAQWVQTNGPYGNIYRVFAQVGDSLIAGWNGGVFLSTDNGISWKPRNNGLTCPYVTDLVVSGSNIFASTLEGIFISTDKCSTWQAVNNGLTELGVYTIVAKSPNIIAGTSNGIFRSNDNGDKWTDISPGSDSNYLYVNALIFKGNSLFAATNQGVFRSDDNGSFWISANNGLADCRVYCFTECDSDLFAATNKIGIYRSTDNGNSWNEVNPISSSSGTLSIATMDSILFVGTYNDGVFRSIDHGSIWVPVNAGLTSPRVSYLSVIGNDIYSTTHDGVFCSRDEGNSWNKVSNVGMSNANISNIESLGFTLFAQTPGNTLFTINYGMTWKTDDSALSDTQVRKIIASGTNYFAATDMGVFLSTDYGNTWIEVNTGLPNINVKDICVGGNNVYVATYGSGIFYSSNNGRSWSHTYFLPEHYLIIDPQKPPIEGVFVNKILAVGDTLVALLDKNDDNMFRYVNPNTKWTRINNSTITKSTNATAVIGSCFIIGTPSGILVSKNAGLDWTIVNRDFRLSRCFAIDGTNLFASTFISNPNNSIYAGVMLSTDSGAVWTPINYGLPNIEITDLTVCGNFLFAGTRYGGVWRRSISDILTSIDQESDEAFNGVTLLQNFPNPFYSNTTIRFSIPTESKVQLKILDHFGRVIEEFVLGVYPPGRYDFQCNLPDLHSGIYFYQLNVGSFIKTKVLIKL